MDSYSSTARVLTVMFHGFNPAKAVIAGMCVTQYEKIIKKVLGECEKNPELISFSENSDDSDKTYYRIVHFHVPKEEVKEVYSDKVIHFHIFSDIPSLESTIAEIKNEFA